MFLHLQSSVVVNESIYLIRVHVVCKCRFASHSVCTTGFVVAMNLGVKPSGPKPRGGLKRF